MALLVAKWGGECKACGKQIAVGEQMHYFGPKNLYHPACAPTVLVEGEDVPLGANKWPSPCRLCGGMKAPGVGKLVEVGTKPNGTPKWAVECKDAEGCKTKTPASVEKPAPQGGVDWFDVAAKMTQPSPKPPVGPLEVIAAIAEAFAPPKPPAAKKPTNKKLATPAVKAGAAQAAEPTGDMMPLARAFVSLADGIAQQPELCALVLAPAENTAIKAGMVVALRADRMEKYLGLLCAEDLRLGRVLNVSGVLVEFGGIRALVPANDLMVVEKVEG